MQPSRIILLTFIFLISAPLQVIAATGSGNQPEQLQNHTSSTTANAQTFLVRFIALGQPLNKLFHSG